MPTELEEYELIAGSKKFAAAKFPRLQEEWRDAMPEAMERVLASWDELIQVVEMLQTSNQALQEDSLTRDRLIEELDKRIFDVHAGVQAVQEQLSNIQPGGFEHFCMMVFNGSIRRKDARQ